VLQNIGPHNSGGKCISILVLEFKRGSSTLSNSHECEHMDLEPISRLQLQNRATKRRLDISVQQACIEIISEVVSLADSGYILRHYSKKWPSLTEEFKDGVLDILKKKFPGSSIYFCGHTEVSLIVDWS